MYNQDLVEEFEHLDRAYKQEQNRNYDLQEEIKCLLHSLEDIKKMNSLGKTKQIADEIDRILNYYNKQ